MKVGDRVLSLGGLKVSEGSESFEIIGFGSSFFDEQDLDMICLKNVKDGHHGNNVTLFNEKGDPLGKPYDGYQYWFETKRKIVSINDLDRLYENRYKDSFKKYLRNKKLI